VHTPPQTFITLVKDIAVMISTLCSSNDDKKIYESELTNASVSASRTLP
jgi:hypothetical protein